MDKISLTIDDQEISVNRGTTVLEAAQKGEIYIPTLCAHPDLKPFGGCRMCIVEIEKMRGYPPSCTTPASDGMVVKTNTTQLNQLRLGVMELLLTEHPNSCLTCHRRQRCGPFDVCLRHAAVTERCVVCPKNYRCELQTVVDYLGINEIRLPFQYKDLPIERGDPLYDRNYNLCILCGRCVRICDEVVGAHAIDFTFRGSQALVGTAFNVPLTESGCIFCGSCVDVCPTGSLVERANQWLGPSEDQVTTTCPYCAVGCSLKLEIKKDKIIRVFPNPDGPANKGRACSKGRFGMDFIYSPDRLNKPLIKRNGQFEEASWDEALNLVSSQLAKYKGDEFAGISSAKCTNEENYLFQKFVRSVMETNNVDHSARLCHSPTVAGMLATFGSGAMTNSFNELEKTSCLMVIGANPGANHPVASFWMKRAIRFGGAKLIVINPREIDLCRMADIWIRPRSGSDVALLMGMMRVILEEGLADQAFIAERCENFEDFKQSLEAFPLDKVETITGVPQDQIVQAARLYATSGPAMIFFTMGITQHSHGTDNVMALANLAMLTGNVGKVGAGVNPLRGHNNVQGSCDMGALPDYYPGYQKVTDPAAQAKFAAAWGCTLGDKPGPTLTEIFDAAVEGKIKALYIMGENALMTDPNSSHVEKALNKLEFMVAQEIFLTETARLADVVLPATSFAEKDGTFTSTERRVQRVRRAIDPIGDSRPDWLITCQIAKRMGAKGFDFGHPSEIMKEIAQLTPQYGGVNYDRLEQGSLQWPCYTPDHPGTPTLHTTQFSRGKGKFMPLEYRPPAELPDDKYPLILSTGRHIHQFHSIHMTGRAAGLRALYGEEQAELNPKDAAELDIADGDRIRVISRRGKALAKARLTEASPPGVIFMTFHFPDTAVNFVTNNALDPIAKMAELKVCAVRVEKVKEAAMAEKNHV
ncbi:MAG: formate dehydrogenase subunit alpha [Chloroflexi bacterium]|nr:formate dehydrogenase subunit alpha [Chloroflexota bacterium]